MTTGLFIVLLILAVLLWAAAVGNLATIHHKDACGRGMAESFAVLATGALWLLMALMLLMACLRQGVEPAAACVLAALHVLSGISTIAAIFLIQGRATWIARWPFAYPAVIPLLLMAWCTQSYFAAPKVQVLNGVVSATAWGMIVAMSFAFAARTAAVRIRLLPSAN